MNITKMVQICFLSGLKLRFFFDFYLKSINNVFLPDKYNSRLFNKSVNGNEKFKRLLIYGTVAYVILHAVLFVGGETALLYNFRHYFWIILGLDLCTLVNDLESSDSMINKVLGGQKDEIKSEYRVDIQNATINDIMASQVPEQNINTKPENEPVLTETPVMPKKKEKERKKKTKKVKFDFTSSNNTSSGSANTDFNKYSQPIINPNHITPDSIMSKPSPKSTPLDTLFRERSMNPNDFMANDADADGYQSFSDSESEYSSDLDMDSFEKGLTM